jgi:hypothetical protein
MGPQTKPVSPSDAYKPLTVVGSAVQDDHGCIRLRTDSVTYVLIGVDAPKALAHSKVRVSALPGGTPTIDCGEPVLTVRQVEPA